MSLYEPKSRLREALEKFLAVLWMGWICVLPLGHVTGLRNALGVLVCVVTVAAFGVKRLVRIPARFWIVGLVTWAVGSMWWSADWQISLSKLQSDLILPISGYCAAYIFVTETSGKKLMPWAICAASIGLAVISLFAWMPASNIDAISGIVSFKEVAALNRRMPTLYPGVGDASMFVALVFGPLVAWCNCRGSWRPGRTGLTVLSLGISAIVTGNRNLLVTLPIALLLMVCARAIWVDPAAKTHAWRRAFSVNAPAAILLAASLGAIVLELVSREIFTRAGQAIPPGLASIALISRDSRPDAWWQYFRAGWAGHPLVGVGYGRTLPAIAYDVRHNPAFANLDPALFSHAHNTVIDIWLEIGIVGLLLFLGSVLAVAKSLVENAKANASSFAAAIAGLSVIGFAMVRGMTDDFLVYSGAETFWIFLGVALAWQQSPRNSNQVGQSSKQLAIADKVPDSPDIVRAP